MARGIDKRFVFAAAAIALVALIALVVRTSSRRPSEGAVPSSEAVRETAASRKTDAQTPSGERSRVRVVESATGGDEGGEDDDGLSPADRRLADLIDDLNGADDKSALVALDSRVHQAKSPQVRESYVDAMSFYGASTIGVISSYLDDPDEDVAQSAKNHFESALTEIDDESTKLDILCDVFSTSTDADFLDNLSTEINSADEKAAIEAILRIWSTGTREGVKVALESYEFITGEEFTDEAAADAWLVENYNPPEDD